MQLTAEQKFHRAMVRIVEVAKREVGYNASRFLQMISARGGVERLDGEIEVADVDRIQLKARLAGLRAQRDALAAMAGHQRPAEIGSRSETPNLKVLDRTDAIVESAARDKPSDVNPGGLGRLEAGGCAEPGDQVVASTLNFLERRGRIKKTGRGRYAA